jgi:hypothetical protein
MEGSHLLHPFRVHMGLGRSRLSRVPVVPGILPGLVSSGPLGRVVLVGGRIGGPRDSPWAGLLRPVGPGCGPRDSPWAVLLRPVGPRGRTVGPGGCILPAAPPAPETTPCSPGPASPVRKASYLNSVARAARPGHGGCHRSVQAPTDARAVRGVGSNPVQNQSSDVADPR